MISCNPRALFYFRGWEGWLVLKIYPNSPLFQAFLKPTFSGLNQKISLMGKSFSVLASLKWAIVSGSTPGAHCRYDAKSNNKMNSYKTVDWWYLLLEEEHQYSHVTAGKWQKLALKASPIVYYRKGHRIKGHSPHLGLYDFVPGNAVSHTGLSWSTTNFILSLRSRRAARDGRHSPHGTVCVHMRICSCVHLCAWAHRCVCLLELKSLVVFFMLSSSPYFIFRSTFPN